VIAPQQPILVAHARIEAIARDAKFKVEPFSLDTQTKLLADCLESADAKAILESVLTPAQLMPPMSLKTSKPKKPKGAGADVGTWASDREHHAKDELDAMGTRRFRPANSLQNRRITGGICCAP